LLFPSAITDLIVILLGLKSQLSKKPLAICTLTSHVHSTAEHTKILWYRVNPSFYNTTSDLFDCSDPSWAIGERKLYIGLCVGLGVVDLVFIGVGFWWCCCLRIEERFGGEGDEKVEWRRRKVS
jgi:hypothetical protein